MALTPPTFRPVFLASAALAATPIPPMPLPPTLIPTITPIPPTLIPTTTPMVLLPPLTMTAIVIVPTLVSPVQNQLPPPPLLPPDNRFAPPPNSYRLGDFTVEGYCNSRGYGIALANNSNDWACTNPSNGSIVYVLTPTDFDNICRTQYNNLGAFAIRDQQKPIQAYNWSCYAYISTAATPTPVPVATASYTTLVPRVSDKWLALVNISNIPLSVENVQFK